MVKIITLFTLSKFSANVKLILAVAPHAGAWIEIL